jgi:hypothetical protein
MRAGSFCLMMGTRGSCETTVRICQKTDTEFRDNVELHSPYKMQ